MKLLLGTQARSRHFRLAATPTEQATVVRNCINVKGPSLQLGDLTSARVQPFAPHTMDDRPPKKARLDDAGEALLPGWTEHTAPSGHKYYYHKATKKSTYKRPSEDAVVPPPAPQVAKQGASAVHPSRAHLHDAAYQPPVSIGFPAYQQPAQPYPTQTPLFPQSSLSSAHGIAAFDGPQRAPNAHPSYVRPNPRRQPDDRPKRKEVIPDCGAWILVYTRLGRRFVHNTETKESFWKFPEAVMKAVLAFDQVKLKEKYDKTTGKDRAAGESLDVDREPEQPGFEVDDATLEKHRAAQSDSLKKELEEDAALLDEEEGRVWIPPAQDNAPAYDSSEYEEVEVTDSEGGGSDDGHHEDGPVEFDEDDIAYQLAAMGEQYGLDEDEYGDGEDGYTQDGEDGDAPLTDEERYQIFAEMLSDHGISPFTPWESLVNDTNPHTILHDDRFTIIPTSRGRKDAHSQWSKETIALQQSQKAQQKDTEEDPKTKFLQFLVEAATPKLYWVEFRRKFRKDPRLKVTSKFTEKAQEKTYREFIAKIKAGKEG